MGLGGVGGLEVEMGVCIRTRDDACWRYFDKTDGNWGKSIIGCGMFGDDGGEIGRWGGSWIT